MNQEREREKCMARKRKRDRERERQGERERVRERDREMAKNTWGERESHTELTEKEFERDGLRESKKILNKLISIFM